MTPPAFRAAIPVGATTTNGLCVRDARFRKNVVFPVPAFPVRKIWAHVLLINRTARSGMLSYSTSDVTGSFLKFLIPYHWNESAVATCKYAKRFLQINSYDFSFQITFASGEGERSLDAS